MIEHTIGDKIMSDPLIQEYCGDKIFPISAPDGTDCPYIVIKDSVTRHEDDVIAMFNISINIYEYNVDVRPLQKVMQRIEDLLNQETFEDENGIYSDVRVWFNSAEHIEGDDPEMSYMFMSFSARACKEIQTN